MQEPLQIRHWDEAKGMWVIPAVPPEVIEKALIVKREIREPQAPYFSDDEILYYLSKNKGNVKDTIYEMLIIKSEDSSVQLSGYSSGDTSAYFKRLASKYTTRNSGNLGGEFV